MKRIVTAKLFPYAVFLFITLVFYGNTLSNGFVHDDVWAIEKNPQLASWGNLAKVLTGCLVEEALGGCKEGGIYYRPVLSLTQLITFQVLPEPWFFHLMQLVYVWLVAIAGYRFFTLFLPRVHALFGVVFFLAHPINTEVVNWVSSASEPLVGSWLLLTLTAQKLIFSSLFFLLALFTKESAVFFPLLTLLAIFLFKKSKKSLPVGKNYYALIAWIIPFFIYGGARFLALGSLYGSSQSYYNLELLTQATSALTFYPRYIFKLIYPLPLAHAHTFAPIGLTDWRVFASLVFWVLSILAVFILYRRREKIILLGFLWFFVTLLPALVFVNRLGEFPFAERYLFVPSIGFALVVADLLRRLKQKLALGLLILYLGSSWWIVFHRNMDWKDNLSLWTDTASKSPKSATAYYNLAHAYASRGDLARAIDRYEKTIEVDPFYVKAYVNLGTVHFNRGELRLAETFYKKALSIEPNFFYVRYNLGNVYRSLGRSKEAALEYKKVLEEDPNFSPATKALQSL